jgi:replicative DNA helicase
VKPATRRETDIQRTPPHSVECEQGVLSSMLLDTATVAEMSREITSDYFYQPAHATTFALLIEMWRDHQPVDLISVTNELRKRKLLEQIGGAAFITSLSLFVPTAANVRYYADVVIEKHKLRNIVHACTKAVQVSMEANADEDTVKSVKRTLWEMLRETESRKISSITAKTVDEVRELVYERQVGSELGLLTGINAWDESLHGIFRRRFYVLGARPKVGKTALIEQAAQWQISHSNHVLIFERDMSPADLMARMACRAAGVVFEDFNTGTSGERELANVLIALEAMPTEYLHIYNPANLSSEDLVSIVEREIEEHDIKVWYLDLFQRLRTREREKVEGLTDAANAIREVIQSTGVPGVVLAELLKQTDRPWSKKEGDKRARPHSGQFKYCDGLFSACDTSILLWSDEDPKDLVDEDGGKRRQKVTFTVDANRAGSVGDNVMYFDRPKMTFFAEP